MMTRVKPGLCVFHHLGLRQTGPPDSAVSVSYMVKMHSWCRPSSLPEWAAAI